jgi:hypothetical protein
MFRPGRNAIAMGAAGVACAVAVSLWFVGRGNAVAASPHPVWTEAQWPFPMDEWGQGRAFQCRAADCGVAVTLYVRAKIGFCNCTTGVADDAELERLSDFALMGGRVKARGEGKPIAVGWMKGRSRAYAVANPERGALTALSAAFNSDCDAIVATTVLERDQLAELEPAVMGFLNGAAMLRWARTTLGLAPAAPLAN